MVKIKQYLSVLKTDVISRSTQKWNNVDSRFEYIVPWYNNTTVASRVKQGTEPRAVL